MDESSVQELESLDPQKRELLEARFLERVSIACVAAIAPRW